jgi:hypothetical protein
MINVMILMHWMALLSTMVALDYRHEVHIKDNSINDCNYRGREKKRKWIMTWMEDFNALDDEQVLLPS